MFDTYWQVDYLSKVIIAFGSKEDNVSIILDNQGSIITQLLLKFEKPLVFFLIKFHSRFLLRIKQYCNLGTHGNWLVLCIFYKLLRF